MGLGLVLGSLFAARILWDRMREISWWLIIDAVLLASASAAMVSDPLSLTRMAVMAVPGMALAIGCLVTSGAGARPRTGSARADLVG